MSVRPIIASTTLFLALSAGTALAAPQMLAVVATNDARPMLCGAEECSVILGTFCLQKDRKPPAYGTPYAPVGGEGLTVVVRTGAGETLRLPAEGLLRFASYAGYTSIRAVLDLSRLAGLDAREVAVEVNAQVTMAALPQPDDPEPLDEAEIALATGPLRAAGEALFERPGERADAARLIASAINLMPEDDTGEPAPGDLWHRLAARRAGLTPQGVARGRRMFEACQRQIATSIGLGLRDCLEMRHDKLMREINETYWEAIKSGV
ncbi:MAG: hypothetical protein ACE5JZ_07715 [Kiloniellales bacterium]